MTKNVSFREYCEKTTLPCMKYFMMNHRSLMERLTKYFFIFIIKYVFS